MAFEYYATDLPGKTIYPKKFNVEIRKLTAIEQKQLFSLSQKQQKTNDEYINFIKSMVRFDNPEMTFEELYWYDVQYLLYKIRFLTYPQYPIKLSFKCECGDTIEHTLNIGDLTINEPNLEKPQTINLEKIGEVKIRNKIIADDIAVETFLEKHPDLDGNDLGTRLLLLDMCLISEGKDLETLYALTAEDAITAMDFINIEKWFTENNWGVLETVNVTCPKCKKEASRGYLLSIEDFFSIV